MNEKQRVSIGLSRDYKTQKTLQDFLKNEKTDFKEVVLKCVGQVREELRNDLMSHHVFLLDDFDFKHAYLQDKKRDQIMSFLRKDIGDKPAWFFMQSISPSENQMEEMVKSGKYWYNTCLFNSQISDEHQFHGKNAILIQFNSFCQRSKLKW